MGARKRFDRAGDDRADGVVERRAILIHVSAPPPHRDSARRFDEGIVVRVRGSLRARMREVQRDEVGVSRPEIGSSGASVRGFEVWRKQTELRHESDLLRKGSGRHQASEKSSKHHKPSKPVSRK
jgi:hypothetical protein